MPRCAHIRVLRTRARRRGCARCLSVGPIPRICKPSWLKLRLRPRLSPGITTSFCRTPPVAGRISSLPSEDFAQDSILFLNQLVRPSHCAPFRSYFVRACHYCAHGIAQGSPAQSMRRNHHANLEHSSLHRASIPGLILLYPLAPKLFLELNRYPKKMESFRFKFRITVSCDR